MNVLVVGANGQIGKMVVEKLQESKQHEVRAMVRKEEQVADFESKGITAKLADLEGSVADIQLTMEGVDAVVFSAGSGGSTGYDKTIMIDLDGAAKTIEAAEKAGVKRFIMVSSIASNHREKWSDDMKPYMAAKHYADQMLEKSDLDYTIFRPGMLKDEPGTGKIQLGKETAIESIPREDVASTIVSALDHSNISRQAFDLISGNTEIKEALNQIDRKSVV